MAQGVNHPVYNRGNRAFGCSHCRASGYDDHLRQTRPYLSKFNLVLLIHAHQPVGNFDDVMERTYERSYLPFVECLARHPRVRLGLHYTGSLLEWIAEKHPEYIQRIGALVARGQVEIAGGGVYETILIA